jgi:hypothetical protein
MGKSIEGPLPANARMGRFYVAIDEDEGPVDWDCAVARFLLAVTARESWAPAAARAGQPSLASPLLVPNECSGLNSLSNCCTLQEV